MARSSSSFTFITAQLSKCWASPVATSDLLVPGNPVTITVVMSVGFGAGICGCGCWAYEVEGHACFSGGFEAWLDFGSLKLNVGG